MPFVFLTKLIANIIFNSYFHSGSTTAATSNRLPPRCAAGVNLEPLHCPDHDGADDGPGNRARIMSTNDLYYEFCFLYEFYFLYLS
jgi:hypothetical protein